MPWDPSQFHPLAFAVLEEQTGKPFPLTSGEFLARNLPRELLAMPPAQLFPCARDPQAALSGLFLLAGHWELCHETAQETATREGSYWHAIAHRLEPDFWNSGYWFERVGEHPIYPVLHEQARIPLASIASWQLKSRWDSKLFTAWCEEARADSDIKRDVAGRIQRLECELLFSWCALKIKDF